MHAQESLCSELNFFNYKDVIVLKDVNFGGVWELVALLIFLGGGAEPPWVL